MVQLMDNIDEIVRVNIFTRMQELNLSQKKLAILTGLTVAYINKLLKGKKPVSKSKSLALIAEKLHVRESDLYQNPAVIASAMATAEALKSENQNQKQLTKMLSDHLAETVSENKELKVKASRQSTDISNPDIRELIKAWHSAQEDWQRDFALYILTGKYEYLKQVSPEVKRRLEKGLHLFGIMPRGRSLKK